MKFDFKGFFSIPSISDVRRSKKTVCVKLDRNYVSYLLCSLLYLREEKSDYMVNGSRKCCFYETSFQLTVFLTSTAWEHSPLSALVSVLQNLS